MKLEIWQDHVLDAWQPLGSRSGFAARTDNERAGFQEDRRFEVGSAFKAFVAAEYARQVADGALDPDRRLVVRTEDRVASSDALDQLLDGATITTQDAAEAMIAVSDNTATDLVLREVGADNVRWLLADLGLRDTTTPDSTRSIYERFAREPGWRPQVCLTTMRDLTTFYAAVVGERALGAGAATDRFLDLLRQEDRLQLQGASWPGGVTCYRKSGLLEPPPQLAMGLAGAFVGAGSNVVAFAFALNVDFPENAAFDESPLEPVARTFSEGLAAALRELAERLSSEPTL